MKRKAKLVTVRKLDSLIGKLAEHIWSEGNEEIISAYRLHKTRPSQGIYELILPKYMSMMSDGEIREIANELCKLASEVAGPMVMASGASEYNIFLPEED